MNSREGGDEGCVGRVLVVERDEGERRALLRLLREAGFVVFGAEGVDDAANYVHAEIDVVVADHGAGGKSGVGILPFWKERAKDSQLIVYTADPSIDSAVDAVKEGAYDYLKKPVDPGELVLLIKNAIAATRWKRYIG